MPSFWKRQAHLRQQTTIYLACFFGVVILAAGISEMLWRWSGDPDYSYDSNMPYVGLSFLALTFFVSFFNYVHYLTVGGSAIAETLGGECIPRDTNHPTYRIVWNIIEELCIASELPAPKLYLIPNKDINAFAAGMHKNSWVIGITRGALHNLNREEMQGVLAHEFGHLQNGDMRLQTSVSVMIMSLAFLAYIGLRFIDVFSRSALRNRYSRNKRQEDSYSSLFLLGGILLVAGAFGGFFGSILRSMLSHTREFLADATAVEFTRSTQGLVGALKKIATAKKENNQEAPMYRFVYAHLFFDNTDFLTWLFSTHPPIEERIRILEQEQFSSSGDCNKPFTV